MSNQLALKINSMDDLSRIGKAFAASGMFQDAKEAAQAIVKIQAGAELGLPPFAAMSGVHIIKGKPVIGAGMIASMIDAHPEYEFQVTKHNDKVCSIDFFKNGKKRGTSTFTIEDARKAGTQNLQKFPANMLYARAMSNGAKWYCPGVFAGPVYVPEEMQDVAEATQDIGHLEVNAPTADQSEEPEPESEITQAEEVPDQSEEPEPAPSPAPAKKPDGEPITTSQKSLIQKLVQSHVITPEERGKMLESIPNLTKDRAKKSIDKLLSTISERKDKEAQTKAA